MWLPTILTAGFLGAETDCEIAEAVMAHFQDDPYVAVISGPNSEAQQTVTPVIDLNQTPWVNYPLVDGPVSSENVDMDRLMSVLDELADTSMAFGRARARAMILNDLEHLEQLWAPLDPSLSQAFTHANSRNTPWDCIHARPDPTHFEAKYISVTHLDLSRPAYIEEGQTAILAYSKHTISHQMQIGGSYGSEGWIKLAQNPAGQWAIVDILEASIWHGP